VVFNRNTFRGLTPIVRVDLDGLSGPAWRQTVPVENGAQTYLQVFCCTTLLLYPLTTSAIADRKQIGSSRAGSY
jgi:hypothetical protein